MKRLAFLLPFVPLMLGALALILLPNLVQSELVLSFRIGFGFVLFFAGLLMTLWIQSLAMLDANREKRARAKTDEVIRDQEAGHRRFIRRLDHELKNPLTSLQASLENLQAATDDAMRQKAEASIERSLERLVRLLRDLRKLSDLEESMLEREPVDIPELLEEILEVVRATPGREGREVKLLVTQAPTPPRPVLGDRDLLGLGLYNLLDNALKFTVQKEAVEALVRDNGRAVVVEVADSGPGIPSEEQGRVFDELFRGENARAVEGSGLGLSFVKRIVELHGGELGLRSQQDSEHGTIFTVRLPVRRR